MNLFHPAMAPIYHVKS